MTPEKQSEKFHETVRKLLDAGDLNPAEADAEFDRLLGKVKRKDGLHGQ